MHDCRVNGDLYVAEVVTGFAECDHVIIWKSTILYKLYIPVDCVH